MDFVNAAPEYVAAAAADLGNIGSALGDANLAALAPTSGILPAGADSVSSLIAELFSAHAEAYQALSAQAGLFHQQFVQLMNAGASAYSNAEAANVLPMQSGLQPAEQALLSAVNIPGTAAPGPAATPLIPANVTGGYTLAASRVTGGAGATATPISPVSSGAGALFGRSTGGAVAGPAANAVSAAATGENAELVAASEPAQLSAAAAQPPLMYGPNTGGAGARGSFGQAGGFRGPVTGVDAREGEPA
jgi:hypothetical protein